MTLITSYPCALCAFAITFFAPVIYITVTQHACTTVNINMLTTFTFNVSDAYDILTSINFSIFCTIVSSHDITADFDSRGHVFQSPVATGG